MVFLASVASASIFAQAPADSPPAKGSVLPSTTEVGLQGRPVKVVPNSAELDSGVPFSIDSRRSGLPLRLQFIAPDQMTEHDRDLAADAESTIQERAGFENLEFNEGHWAYAQIACPALPNHLLLRFTRNDGTREMSMFSAAIPRNGEGRVRIIPIVRKGYSLFSPAPIGALTIAAFNHIRLEDKPASAPDWLTTGLCYAALAGADPDAEQLQSTRGEGPPIPLTNSPTLVIAPDGGAIIHFDDLSAAPRVMQWSISFDRTGKLLKATHVPVKATAFREVPNGPAPVSDAAPPIQQP
ncbi:MAG TPA: hypothetical protein VGG85_05750 [Terracidiphilus sp.]